MAAMLLSLATLIAPCKILLLSLLLSSLHGLPAAVPATSVEVFVDRDQTSHSEPTMIVPAGTNILTFLVKPTSPYARCKLEGIDEKWKQRVDTMFLRVVFYNQKGDQIQVHSFPTIGQSAGWKTKIEDSPFVERLKSVTVPDHASSMSLIMTTAGPSSLLGVFAIRDINVFSVPKGETTTKVLISDTISSEAQKIVWSKSGTHPSMATTLKQDDEKNSPLTLVILDDDINAHADWTTNRINVSPEMTSGDILQIGWKEAFSTGLGGEFTEIYERLPAGKYRFVVEDLSLTGAPLQAGAYMTLTVKEVYWKTFWFWGVCGLFVALVSIIFGRYLIRKKIRLHIEQERMISAERQRIARDLHDDIGTRVSHISLLASHADNTIRNEEANKAFAQISSMSRDLIGALSETVWMLNSNNNDLESLVDFLYRLVQELCRLKKIRCRVDAVFITQKQAISYEFRHNVSLAVKESVNNVLKHSEATELNMKIELEGNVLSISIADNGIGITEASRSNGLGLNNLQSRMKSIGGTCKFAHLDEGGLCIMLTAPIS